MHCYQRSRARRDDVDAAVTLRRGALLLAVLGLAAALLTGCAGMESRRNIGDEAVRAASLRKAGSSRQLLAYVDANRTWFEEADAHRQRSFCALPANLGHWSCKPQEEGAHLDRIEVTGSRIDAADIITNNQEQGVDEGDIVKKLGDRLFVLREGKLHVIDLVVDRRPDLRVSDTLVVATDIEDDRTTWYDELLAVDGMLVLLGFNWSSEAAELSLFDVASDGRLTHRLRYWLRVDDYFSGSNYGARIEGENLLISLSMALDGASGHWPEWSRRDLDPAQWQSLVEPEDVHLPLAIVRHPKLHVVLRCPLHRLAAGSMECRATGLIGSSEHEFYASSHAAYLSISEWHERVHLDPRFERWRVNFDDTLRDLRAQRYTLVYRIPFDDAGELGVVRLDGITGNQFSFLERDGDLFVTTDRELGDDRREVTLWRAASAAFDASGEHPADVVARLAVADAHRTFRFTRNALWIGAHAWSMRELPGSDTMPPLLRQPLSGASTQSIPSTHSVELIEPLGPVVLTSGTDPEGNWRLSLIDDSDAAVVASDSLAIPGYVPSESRSHAFNAGRIDGRWVFGMPVIGDDVDDYWEVVSDLALFELPHGRLDAPAIVDMQQAVHCDEHCYDWYGNARVFFIGDRLFGLSGGLLRELKIDSGALSILRSIELN